MSSRVDSLTFTEQALLTFVDRLRGAGVKSYKGQFDGDLIELELGPPVIAEPQPSKPEADPDKCRCGHMVYEHNQGLCLVGCDAEKCVEPEQ